MGLARVGSDSQRIVAGTMAQLQSVDFGAPLHSLVIAGATHPIEDEILARFRLPAGAGGAADNGAGAGAAAAAGAAGEQQ